MSAAAHKGQKKRSKWHIVLQILIAFVIIHYYPDVKKALFPDQMTRLEKLLRHSNTGDCNFTVERRDQLTILLTLKQKAASPITTEIYRDVVRELEPSSDSRIFFAHSINDNAEGVTYLTRTLIEADPDLKKVRRLEVSVCDRIKDQTGQVPYDGHEPIYECEVPIQKAVCLATE